MTVDNQALAACEDVDPKHLADNAEIKATMTEIGLAPGSIRFRGCAKAMFFIDSEWLPGAKSKYVITYPADVRVDFLAPVTHELAHALQANQAGNLEELARTTTPHMRAELGADYLSGFVYKRMGRDRSQFLLSLDVLGKYYEQDANAHGTPSQRAAAFRMGYFSDTTSRTLAQASQEFSDDGYGHVVRL